MSRESLSVEVDLGLYCLEAVQRACYKLTDRCRIALNRPSKQDETRLVVTLTGKQPGTDLATAAADLADDLLDQQLRQALIEKTGALREIIVAQAFAEGNLLDALREDGDYEADPLGIGTTGGAS